MKILLGVAHTGTVAWGSGQSAWRCSAEHEVEVASIPTSLPTLAFNSLYADALNRNEEGCGVTHFAMLHGDLAADGFWIDTLMRLSEEHDADLVSAVNAIKDDRGLTSCGVAIPGHTWRPWRRFTLRELSKWPMTFTAKDVGYEGHVLLHNTGCWLADLRKPVFHEQDEYGQLRAYFTVNDHIVRRNGRWIAEVEPEDWFFSRRLYDLNAHTLVTREVVTHHFGVCDCDNQTERGTLFTDTDVQREWDIVCKEMVRANS